MIINLKPYSHIDWYMFGDFKPFLSMILFDAIQFLERHGIKEVILTSGVRPKENDTGVHAVFRAVDFVIPGIADDLRLLLLEYINQKYIYDEARKYIQTLVYHEGSGYNGDRGKHFHLQVL